jgi:hypothetical protein
MTNKISREAAEQLAIDVIRKKKNYERINVATIDQNDDNWIVRGTCPIDMEGHPWTEKFEVIVNLKGRVKSMDLALL